MQDTFVLITGQPRQGKGLELAQWIDYLYHRNKKWYEESGVLRQIYLNLTLRPEYLKGKEKFFVKWSNLNEIVTLTDVDIVIDEGQVYFHAYRYEALTDSQLFWLAHYAKNGCEIYMVTQSLRDISRPVREKITSVYQMFKLIGSPTPSNTRPPIKKVWGLVMGLSIVNFKDDEEALKKPNYRLFPPRRFFPITKKLVDIYDTREIIRPDLADESYKLVNQITKLERAETYAKKLKMFEEDYLEVKRLKDAKISEFKALVKGFD